MREYYYWRAEKALVDSKNCLGVMEAEQIGVGPLGGWTRRREGSVWNGGHFLVS